MTYTKKKIGEELKIILSRGYNIGRISNWADELFFSVRGKRSPELDDILRHIFLMDAGPEFEYTEQELKLLAEMLINEEENPIKKINEKSKEENTSNRLNTTE
jgi:hypothetical protein